MLEHVAAFAPRPSHRIAGGNQGLALAMAARLGDRVRLRTPVRALDGEQVLTDGGALAARHVIVTLPLPLARTLPITPALPDRQRAALDRAELGHAAKLHVPLASAAATSAVMSVPDRYWCWTATGHDGAVAPVLNCFAGSPRALDGLRLDDGPPAGSPASPRSARTSTWRRTPSSRPGTTTRGRAGPTAPTACAPSRATTTCSAPPAGTLHFAGEHTAGAWSGLMEGALRSGLRAAAEVVNAP